MSTSTTSRVGLAIRSAVAMAMSAVVGWYHGITQIELANASLAAFISILCVSPTLGGTLEMAVDVLAGGCIAAVANAPFLLVPESLRAEALFAAFALCVQSLLLAGLDFPLGVRMMAVGTAVSLALSPVVDEEALSPMYTLDAIAVLAIGAGSAITSLLVPPWPLAKSAHALLALQSQASVGEAFDCLVKAFCGGGDTNAGHLALVRASFLLKQLEAMPKVLASLRREAEWEPLALHRVVAHCSGGTSQGLDQPSEPISPARLRQVNRMLAMMRMHVDALAEGSYGEELHQEFCRHLEPPLRALTDDIVLRKASGGDARPSPADVQRVTQQLQHAWDEARRETLCPPTEGHVSGWEPRVTANVATYTKGGYSRVVNCFLFSTISYCAWWALDGETHARAAGGTLSSIRDPVRVETRTHRLGGSACLLRACRAGCETPLLCATWSRVAEIAGGARSFGRRRALQYTLAVELAALPLLVPAGRVLFPAAILAPIEAVLQLMSTAGTTAQAAIARVLGTVAGAIAGMVITVAGAGIVEGPLRDAFLLCSLGAWAFAACLLRRSPTHGGAAIVAAWTAPLVAAAVNGGSEPAADALGRCTMALFGAGSVLVTALVLEPRWARAVVARDAADAVADSARVLAEEIRLWSSLLGDGHREEDAPEEGGTSESVAGVLDDSEHLLRVVRIDSSAEGQRWASTTASLEQLRDKWTALAGLCDEDQADATLCAFDGGGAMAGVVGRGLALVEAMAHLLDSVTLATGPGRALLGIQMHQWAWPSLLRRVADMGDSSAMLGTALAGALRLGDSRLRSARGLRGSCDQTQAVAKDRAKVLASDLESAAHAMRSTRSALAAHYVDAVRGSIADGWRRVGMRVSIADAVLNTSACDALLLSAHEFIMLACEVEAFCATAAARAGDHAYGLADDDGLVANNGFAPRESRIKR